MSSGDIRQLFRDRKKQLQTAKRIDSPLASYDSTGSLWCSVCNVKIDDPGQWSAHLINRLHKHKIEQLKKLKNKDDSKSEVKKVSKEPSVSTNTSVKRKQEPEVESNAKQIKLDTSNELPDNFFDNKQENVQIVSESNENNEDMDNLPAGFFDEPKPKVNVPSVKSEKAKEADSEWDAFQKEINSDVPFSDADPNKEDELDLEEMQHERDLDEIEEQFEYWKRINDLEKKVTEKLQNKPMQTDPNEEELANTNESDDDDLEAELISWRTKPKI